MRALIFMLCISFWGVSLGQSANSLVSQLQQRLDTIITYEAKVKISEDISFIDMPTKEAMVYFSKEEPLLIESDDFVLLPKRGLDFSLSELFRYPFITVDRGTEIKDGKSLRVVHLIPEEKKADFSIATLFIEPNDLQVKELEINTRKEGTFYVELDYNSVTDLLPSKAVISFTVEKLRIPLNFMGKDSTIDRKSLRSDEPKEGRILLEISQYKINR